MTAADGLYGRSADRWPDHLSLHTDPVDRRRVSRPTATQQPAPRPPQRQPVQQRPPQQQRPSQEHGQRPDPRRAGAAQRPAGLTAPQVRRRWIGVIASAALAGLLLPVQLGAVAVEALEILSPGPDGSALTMILAAMGAQIVALLIPMLLGPKVGGFTRRWRARLIVLSANAGLVAILALVGWTRVAQA